MIKLPFRENCLAHLVHDSWLGRLRLRRNIWDDAVAQTGWRRVRFVDDRMDRRIGYVTRQGIRRALK